MKNDNEIILQRLRGIPKNSGPSDGTDPNMKVQPDDRDGGNSDGGNSDLRNRICPRLHITREWLVSIMQTDLNQLCKVCGAPFSKHIIGGPGPYHPQPISPDVCWACGDKKEEWWNYCAMCGKHLAAGR